MNTKDIIQLLELISNNKSISLMHNQGFTHSQLLNLIRHVDSRGFLEFRGGELSLTEAGKAYHEHYRDNYIGRSVNILPREEDMIRRLGKDEIFIPINFKL